MARRTLLAVTGALMCTAVGSACGDDSTGSGSMLSDNVRRLVAEALTSSVAFENGVERLAQLPTVTAMSVVVSETGAPIELDPGASSLLPFEIENPDQASDPVVATLIQFEDADSHVEVPVEDDSSETVSVSLPFQVEQGVCDNLCDDRFEIAMKIAAKLREGGVGRHARRSIVLDCSEYGDPDRCETGDDDDGDEGGAGVGGGGAPSTTDEEIIASSFGTAVTDLNRALCECEGTSQDFCEAAWLTREELDCARAAIVDGAVTAEVSELIQELRRVRSMGACSLTDVTAEVLSEDDELPETLASCSDALMPEGDAAASNAAP